MILSDVLEDIYINEAPSRFEPPEAFKLILVPIILFVFFCALLGFLHELDWSHHYKLITLRIFLAICVEICLILMVCLSYAASALIIWLSLLISLFLSAVSLLDYLVALFL
jgi:hypothetical protein